MYLALNELIETIEKNITRLQQGEMEIEEIENHLSLVRELYERTVVLKYKALEAKATLKVVTVPNPVVEKSIEEVKPVVEVVAPIIEKPTFTAPEPEEVEFDLFGSVFSEEKEVAVVEPEFIAEKVAHVEEPIVEETLVEEEIEEEMEEPVSYFNTPVIEEPIEEEVYETVVETVTNSYQDQVVSAFSTKLKEVNTEMKGQFGFTSLNTLIGSFGLNERLLYINELFSGSSDAFSDAVKELDVKTSLSDVSPLIMNYANQYMWDIESPTVTEFMQKLCRRYV